jgi:hypothetical protein
LVALALALGPAVAWSAESAGPAGGVPTATAPAQAVKQGQDDENPLEGRRHLSAPAAAATATTTADAQEEAEADEAPAARHGNLTSWKWGAVLGAGAAMAVGLVMMQQARSDASLLQAARAPAGMRPTMAYDQRIRDAENDYVRTRTWAAVSLIGAGVLGAAAVTLFVVDREGRPRAQARLAPVAGTQVAGLSLEGIF